MGLTLRKPMLDPLDLAHDFNYRVQQTRTKASQAAKPSPEKKQEEAERMLITPQPSPPPSPSPQLPPPRPAMPLGSSLPGTLGAVAPDACAAVCGQTNMVKAGNACDCCTRQHPSMTLVCRVFRLPLPALNSFEESASALPYRAGHPSCPSSKPRA